jgi:hypothetical protein
MQTFKTFSQWRKDLMAELARPPGAQGWVVQNYKRGFFEDIELIKDEKIFFVCARK